MANRKQVNGNNEATAIYIFARLSSTTCSIKTTLNVQCNLKQKGRESNTCNFTRLRFHSIKYTLNTGLKTDIRGNTCTCIYEDGDNVRLECRSII